MEYNKIKLTEDQLKQFKNQEFGIPDMLENLGPYIPKDFVLVTDEVKV